MYFMFRVFFWYKENLTFAGISTTLHDLIIKPKGAPLLFDIFDSYF